MNVRSNLVDESSRPGLAALWMLGTIAAFTAMAVAGREIQTEMNTFELMMYRSLVGLVIIALVLRGRIFGAAVKPTRFKEHLRRNVIHFTAQNLWFYGIATIPLSQLVALEFTSPIWVALLSPLLLGEQMTRARAIAAVLGFIGVLIVAQPGVSPVGIGHGAGLMAAFGFALTTIFTKGISRTDSVICIVFWMTLMQGVFGFILAIPGGIPVPSPAMLPWIITVGISGLAAHYCLTSALRVAPATIVAPLDFLRLPLIAVVGMMIYAEPLMAAVFVGAALILAGNLISLRAESRRKNARA